MNPRTVGELKKAGWRSRSVRDEIRDNLVASIRSGKSASERWPGILGFDKTVIPQVENAILSRHDFILLGLRGQAKTRLLRLMTAFLDDSMPMLEGCELNDDPFAPISRRGRAMVEERGDDAPIVWVPRDDRYREKLATPDVTIADLLGDIDPIKAASRRLSLADEDVLHFGIIPRTNRGIFAINELPDLSAAHPGRPAQHPRGARRAAARLPRCASRSTCCSCSRRTPRTTPTAARSSRRCATASPARSSRTTRTDLDESRWTITDQEAWTERDSVKVHVPRLLREVVEEVAIQRARERTRRPGERASACG